MILVVNLNTAIDRIYNIKNFETNKIHRTNDFLVQTGGKGVNVARALGILNTGSLLTGFLGGFATSQIIDDLRVSNIIHEFCFIKGESRVCTIIIDPETSAQTVINEEGPTVSKGEAKLFIEKFSNLVQNTKFLVLSGSIPQGVDNTFYNQLISIAGKQRVPTILDTSKNALISSIVARFFMVKPNIHEFCEVFGDAKMLEESLNLNFSPLISKCRQLLEINGYCFFITMGEIGGIYIDKNKSVLYKAPKINLVNSIASGDCVSAGIVSELFAGKNLREAIISGIAAGTANAEVGGIKFAFERFLDLRKQVNVEAIGV